ncbi:unnamed protein product [Heterobilharzia americana]|nr:unnamed protein product [Heterobilharzia americana]
MDVCSVCKTCIQDPSIIIHLTSPCQYGESEKFTIRVSGDSMASSRGLAGVGIALSTRAENSLLDWVIVDSRLCAIQLNSTVKNERNSGTRRCLFVISAYAPTDWSSDEVKDEFYRKLSSFLLRAKRSDVVVVEGDFIAHMGKLSEAERHLVAFLESRLIEQTTITTHYNCAHITTHS